jgi:hypothetical protein
MAEVLTSEKFVFVEFDSSGQPVRIFRNREEACQSDVWNFGVVKAWTRKRAVEAIQRRGFESDNCPPKPLAESR